MNESNNNLNPNPQPINNTPLNEQPNLNQVTPNSNQGVNQVNQVAEQQPINPTSVSQNLEQQSTNLSQNVGNSINEISNPAMPNPQPIVNQQPNFNNQQGTTLDQVVQPIEAQNQNLQANTPMPNQVNPINQTPSNVVNNNENINTNQNIQAQNSTPINQVNNQPVNEQNFQNAPTNGVFAPSTPIGGATDVNNVGFVAASSETPKKKKNPIVKVIIILVILVLLALVGYFVIYPYIMKTYFSDPMNVYETTIKEAFKGINNTTNTIIHNKGIYSLEASFDSNIEDLKEFGGYTYGINFGIDPIKKNIQQGLYIKNNSTNVEHSYYSYLKDNKYYDKYSSYRDYIYLGEANSEDIDNFFSSIDIDKLFDFSNNLNNDEITYISDKIATLIIESINKDRLTQEDASISINGESLKVTNNKYEIDYDIAKNMFEYIRNGLKDDEKAIQIISKLTEESTSDIKKTIESMKFPEKSESNSNVVNINIYTYGNKNEIIGFSINDKDENINIYYYNKNGVAEGKITSNYKNTNQQNEMVVIKLTSIKESNGTKITLFYDDEDITDSNKGTELLTLNIKSWDEKGFNIDYKINIEDENFNGNLKFSQDISNEKVKFSLDFSLESGNEFIKVTTSLNEDWTSEIANINTSTAQQLGEEEISIYKNEFMNALKETPIGKALTTVSNDYDNTIGDYYTNNYPNNSTSSNEQIVSGSEEKDNI